jgi:hypothetical protein
LAERLLCKERVRSSSLLVSTTTVRASAATEDLGTTREKPTLRALAGPAARGPPIEPLIRVLPPPAGHRPADRWATGDVRIDLSEARFGPHLNNWIVFGRNEESSISPSSQGNDPDRSRPRLTAWSDAGGGQATKGTGWMPWRQEPMKDVEGCEKLRGVANRL